MAKRKSTKRPYGDPHPELDADRLLGGGLGARVERGPRGEEYKVARVRGSEKSYVCPACNLEISAGVAHVAAWAVDGLFGAEAAAADRRHWHTNCWATFGRSRG